MKNSLQLLALGLVLFLGACSTTEGNFLDKIKGKTAYENATTQDNTTKYGTFTADGKTFTFSDGSGVLPFVKATDENTGEYALGTDTLTITTSDGTTGNIKNKDGGNTPVENLWFK